VFSADDGKRILSLFPLELQVFGSLTTQVALASSPAPDSAVQYLRRTQRSFHSDVFIGMRTVRQMAKSKRMARNIAKMMTAASREREEETRANCLSQSVAYFCERHSVCFFV
jgi:hypothetical protein